VLNDKNIAIELNADSSFVLNGDKLRIEQVMSNLMDNAVKHVNNSGIIRTEVMNRDEYIRLEVFNSGSTINPNETDSIWNSFYKAGDNINDGSGLGLAIVKAIMDLHQGRYGVKNIDGGVSFFVEFPT
jgi:signal transduction histidine kinase